MTELKTLKDMQTFKNCIGNEVFVHKRQLREEAKKWIETLKEKANFTDFNCEFKGSYKDVQDWIEHFFNLGEK